MEKGRPTVKVVAKIHEFMRAYQREPTKLYLTRDMEFELEAVAVEQLGLDKYHVVERGFRAVIVSKGNTIQNLEVIWDADEFKVE